MTGATENRSAWTGIEDRVLRHVYPRSSWSEILAALPGRSQSACFHRACKLGIAKLIKEDPSGYREALAKRMGETKPRLGKFVHPVVVVDDKDCAGGRRNICTTCEGRVAYALNREARIAAVRRYQKTHPDQVRLQKQASEKKRHGRMIDGKGVMASELRELMSLYGGICAYCRVEDADTFDHVTPLSRGGAHEIENLLPACRKCNFEKHQRTLPEWQEYKMRKGA